MFTVGPTTIYALNEDFSPKNLWAPSEEYSPDIYENDNRHGYKSAQVIVVDDSEPQQHNFHKAGDLDWVKFYGLADRSYRIAVVNPGGNCDAVIELYDTEGTTLLLKKDDYPAGMPETFDYTVSKEGIYYVKVFNYNPDIYGSGTDYGLKVYIPTAPSFIGILTGIVSDSVTKEPIKNAEVKTNNMGSSLSNAKGSYTLIEEQGSWTLTVNALGYQSFSQNLSITSGVQTVNVAMTPTGSVNEPEEGLSQIIDYGISLNGIIYSTNLFIASGDYGALPTSQDGKSWTDRGFSTDHELYGIAYGNNTYVSVGDYATILYSADGILWAKATWATENHLYGITCGDGLFIAVGDRGTILTSPDGNIWTDKSFSTNSALYGITYENGLFVAVGDRGTILTSPDGNIWTDNSITTNNAFYGVTYGNAIFVAVGENGMISASSDGTVWADRSVNPNCELNAIFYGNDTFTAVGDSGKLLSSKDGVTWRETKSSTEAGIYGIAYGNGAFVAVGNLEIIFLPDSTQYSLTIVKMGTGDGTATSSPAGIRCGSTCSETFQKPTKVKLTATANPDSIFTGWSGGGCSGTKACQVTVNSPVTITASFDKKVPHISVPLTSIPFGRVKVGKSLKKTLQIVNNGTGDLTVSMGGLEGTDFSLLRSPDITVKPKKSYKLNIAFKPTSTGDKTATLVLNSNDPDDKTISISLTGTGI